MAVTDPAAGGPPSDRASPSTWTPRTCCSSSTPRAPRPRPRASCTPRAAISPRSPSPTGGCSTCIPTRDVYWCAADIGWVTGHSYIVYGPLANGATWVMYEGTPDFPDQDRWWSIIERYGVTILYTAPTAIRTFMKWGAEYPERHDLSSLRVLGSVGEPINPEAWMWYCHPHRRRALPGGRHLVADRDRGHHDRPAAGDHHHQAGIGHLPPARHRCRGGRRGRREPWQRAAAT